MKKDSYSPVERATKQKTFLTELSYRNSIGENLFDNLVNSILKFLTLLHSNADVERLFSQINLIKTKLKNRMHINKLIALLIIYSIWTWNDSDYTLSTEMVSKIGTMKNCQPENHLQNPTSFSNNSDEEIVEIINVLDIKPQ